VPVSDDTLAQLADLVVEFGANVQPGQQVVIQSEPGKEPLTRAVADRAYRAGAAFVHVVYGDPYVQRSRILHGSDEALGYEPEWTVAMAREMGEKRGCRIALSGATAPGLLAGLDAERIGRDRPPAAREWMRILGESTVNWSIIPCPNPGWAKQVYPDADPQEALDELWRHVIHVCRLDEADPVAAWNSRMADMDRAATALTEHRFDALRIRGNGTDVTIGLLPGSLWQAASLARDDGLIFHPNLPTEEVFTTPDPTRTEGVVAASMPLELSGTTVSDFQVRFEAGRVVGIEGGTGTEALQAYANRDEGAARLGEIALVDGGGRIGPLKTVFHDTLLDENAASHMAIGQGFDWAVEPQDRERINRSEIHVDFMWGAPGIEVHGVTAAGDEQPVLIDGAWRI